MPGHNFPPATWTRSGRKSQKSTPRSGVSNARKAGSFFYRRLWSIVRFFLVMTICVLAFIHRVEIAKVCHSVFDRAMKHLTLSPQTRQKSIDYQNQLDEITTNK